MKSSALRKRNGECHGTHITRYQFTLYNYDARMKLAMNYTHICLICLIITNLKQTQFL